MTICPDQRLTPFRRIKRRKDFLRIQSKGKKVRSNHLLLSYCYKDSTDTVTKPESRIGITITTKVHKRAVKRNLLRRRLREIFRKNRMYLQKKVDLVVIALNGSTELDYEQIESELFYGLKKAKLLDKAINDR